MLHAYSMLRSAASLLCVMRSSRAMETARGCRYRWVFWVTCNELLLCARLFEEGQVSLLATGLRSRHGPGASAYCALTVRQVIYAFKMMLATMHIAMPELLAFSAAIIVLMTVCAEAQHIG